MSEPHRSLVPVGDDVGVVLPEGLALRMGFRLLQQQRGGSGAEGLRVLGDLGGIDKLSSRQVEEPAGGVPVGVSASGVGVPLHAHGEEVTLALYNYQTILLVLHNEGAVSPEDAETAARNVEAFNAKMRTIHGELSEQKAPASAGAGRSRSSSVRGAGSDMAMPAQALKATAQTASSANNRRFI